MRKAIRKKTMAERAELKRIEAEARKRTAELAEKQPELLQEEIVALAARTAAIERNRFVVWAFDLGPAGRPVAACDLPSEAVRLAREQLTRQAKRVAPAIQWPGSPVRFWPGWMVAEAAPRALAVLDLAVQQGRDVAGALGDALVVAKVVA